MNEGLRDGVQSLAMDSMEMVGKYFGGKETDATKIKVAMQALYLGVKIEHMNQLKTQMDKSLALRLFQFLPADDHIRKEYLKITNPELKPLLLSRPKK